MAKFRCVHTNNVFEFTQPHDIETMRKHSEYVEVKEEEQQSVGEQKPTKRNKVKNGPPAA